MDNGRTAYPKTYYLRRGFFDGAGAKMSPRAACCRQRLRPECVAHSAPPTQSSRLHARPSRSAFYRSVMPRDRRSRFSTVPPFRVPTARPAIPSADYVHRARAAARSANRTLACRGPTQLIRSHYRPAHRSFWLIAQTRRGREIGQWHAMKRRKGRRVDGRRDLPTLLLVLRMRFASRSCSVRYWRH